MRPKLWLIYQIGTINYKMYQIGKRILKLLQLIQYSYFGLCMLSVGLNGKPIGKPVGSGWIHMYPAGIWKLLRYIKNQYNNPRIYITENGSKLVINIFLELNNLEVVVNN